MEGGSAFFGGAFTVEVVEVVEAVEAVDPFDEGSLSSAMTRLASDFDDALLRQISRPACGDPPLSEVGGDNDADPPSPSLGPPEGRTVPVPGGVCGLDGFFEGGGGGKWSIIV